jgi:MerR family transcriptional regulator/heat shock protein HspR
MREAERPNRLRDVDVPRYVISVAAELSGIHPQTLRAYERGGLVHPARSAGGGRRYSDADLGRIARILELTRMGLPHIGIRMVLDLEDELRRLRASSSPRPAASGRGDTSLHPRRMGEPSRMSPREHP